MNTSHTTRILAIDPGFDRMGIAVIERGTQGDVLLYSTCATTSAKLSFPERLKLLGDAVDHAVEEYTPEALALELLMFGKNQKTAARVSEVRGMLIYKGVSAGLPVHEYTPLQIKVAVSGYGKADKNQVATMVATLIKLPKRKMLDDETDAIAIGLTFLAFAGWRSRSEGA